MNEELKFDRNRKRVKYCPCGKSNRDGKFNPFKGYEQKGYCHSCGETYLPERGQENWQKPIRFTKPNAPSKLDPGLISEHARNFKRNNFVQFLASRFTKEQVQQVISDYCLGTHNHWEGATIFWQIDNHNRVRHGKVMLYDPVTGKRSKRSEGGAYIHSIPSLLKLEDFSLKQCLFGLHLSLEYTKAKVALVEGEKTSIIMSILKPQYLWMATGSKGGFKADMLRPIRDRKIIAFPDKGEYYDWLAKAQELNQEGYDITVNDWLENTDYSKGSDLADVHLQEGNSGKLAAAAVPEKHPLPEAAARVLTVEERNLSKLGEKNPQIYNLIQAFDLEVSK